MNKETQLTYPSALAEGQMTGRSWSACSSSRVHIRGVTGTSSVALALVLNSLFRMSRICWPLMIVVCEHQMR